MDVQDLLFARFTLASTLDLSDYKEASHFVTNIGGLLLDHEEDGTEVPVARVYAWKVHLDLIAQEDRDLWDVLDAEHEELETLYRALFSGGVLKPRIQHLLDLAVPSKLIVIHSLQVEPAYQGHRLGLSLARHVGAVFGGGATLIALLPYPLLDAPTDRVTARRSARALSKHFQQAGFRPMPGSDWLAMAM